ncbi:hypothetical protein SDC9_161748 [bioreactor metagenome]|uniref:Uncharacterized protein n=1 Tax=bioreactor metagenome TaxID=1076179 RepID=A0A645FJ45_9ZZZZ
MRSLSSATSGEGVDGVVPPEPDDGIMLDSRSPRCVFTKSKIWVFSDSSALAFTVFSRSVSWFVIPVLSALKNSSGDASSRCIAMSLSLISLLMEAGMPSSTARNASMLFLTFSTGSPSTISSRPVPASRFLTKSPIVSASASNNPLSASEPFESPLNSSPSPIASAAC